MGLWTAIFWLQLSPINTHRPTQGINAFIVEPNALQIESGYQPFWVSGQSVSHEAVLQVRKGIARRWEGIFTGGVGSPALSVMPLSLTVKGNLIYRTRLALSVAGWGYLPVAGHPSGGQVWLIGDWMPVQNGTLTINLVGGYFMYGLQGFLTAFYTHSLSGRLSAWVEAFVYAPEAPGTARSQYGGGIGGQVILGTARRTAFDIAMNVSVQRMQVLVGISRKFALSAHRRDEQN